MTDYRYPNERLILVLTLGLVLAVIAVTASATMCGSFIFVLLMLGLAYVLNQVHTDELIKAARPVDATQAPRLVELVRQCALRLRPGAFRAFVAPGPILNAYTFGLVEPRQVVIFEGMLRVMDEDELRFVVGHELGHIALGHTWLNSLIGGMAGIPSPYLAAAVLYFAFRWWNRACEYSADRAGLLACGRPEKACSALLKLSGRRPTPGAATSVDLSEAISETLATHPLIAKRVQNLQRFAASAEYRRWQALVDQWAAQAG